LSLRARQTELRLQKASRLLKETDSRVMTIAGQCGYAHLGVFNALFKKRFGSTPMEYRRLGDAPAPADAEANAAANGEVSKAVIHQPLVTEKSPP
jgi:AraC-like DNA-binding protein